MLTVRLASWPLSWRFRMPARCRHLPRDRADALSAEGGGDALVGGISLPADAAGVELRQDGDAVVSDLPYFSLIAPTVLGILWARRS
jgi:hypothetical protein